MATVGGAPVVRDGAVVTRRQLLTAIGVAGGTGVLTGVLATLGLASGDGSGDSTPFVAPSAGDFTLQGRVNDQTVIVVGAGVSGLCCAYELGRAGYRVTVIDAAKRIGGRNRTLRNGDKITHTGSDPQQCEFADGRWMNAGPARIAQHHLTLAYCRELGVALEVFVNVNPQAFVADNTSVFSRRAVQADLSGYVSELLSKAISRDVLDDEVPVTERGRLLSYLDHIGALGRSERGYDVEPGVGVAPDIGAPNQLGTLLRLGFGERVRFENDYDQAPAMLHPAGGMDATTKALAARVIGEIRLEHRVVAIASDDDGVTVTGVDSGGERFELLADHGICTMPPPFAADAVEQWAPRLAGALREPQPVRTGKIGLEYDRRFWELDDHIYGGTSTCNPDSRVIWYPSNDYFAHGGVLIGGYPFGPAADRFSTRTHAERVESAVRIGSSIHGATYADDLRSALSVDWTTQPHAGAAGWYTWRRFGVAYNQILEGQQRWQFAGDWLARTGGWQHGALQSARHAVTQLHRVALAN